jgi:hypothetical protein
MADPNEIVKSYSIMGSRGGGAIGATADGGFALLNPRTGQPLNPNQYLSGSNPASGAAGSSVGGASQSTFAPGQSARFTPDPTVNGAWTHTRADVPLFRTPPATGGMTQPATGGTTPQPGTVTRPQNPAFQGYRDRMRSWWHQRPRRSDRRSMLADAVEGK